MLNFYLLLLLFDVFDSCLIVYFACFFEGCVSCLGVLCNGSGALYSVSGALYSLSGLSLVRRGFV